MEPKKRTYTDEEKAALSGLLPFAPGAYRRFSIQSHEKLPENIRPVFHIHDLNAQHFMTMRLSVRKGNDIDTSIDTEEMLHALIDGGLVGWENLVDSEFNPITFDPEAIKGLPFKWRETIYWECVALCSPNKAEKEGLELSPHPTSESLSKTADDAGVVQA